MYQVICTFGNIRGCEFSRAPDYVSAAQQLEWAKSTGYGDARIVQDWNGTPFPRWREPRRPTHCITLTWGTQVDSIWYVGDWNGCKALLPMARAKGCDDSKIERIEVVEQRQEERARRAADQERAA